MTGARVDLQEKNSGFWVSSFLLLIMSFQTLLIFENIDSNRMNNFALDWKNDLWMPLKLSFFSEMKKCMFGTVLKGV